MTIPILLTATVAPQGVPGAAFDPSQRAAQYVEALRFYLQALPQGRVVLAENSASLDVLRPHFAGETRIEWCDTTTLDEGFAYRPERGKGYNEWLLMHHAVRHSRFIGEAGCFFKVTGRLMVRNVAAMLRECERREAHCRRQHHLPLLLVADCKDHRVYEWLKMPINGHAGECRYFFCQASYFLHEVFPGYGQMDDVAQPPFLAEDLMLQVCRRARQRPGAYDRFRTQARISGRGGHQLGQGSAFFYSTDNDSPALRFKCALRQCLRWLLPWWKC